MKAGAPALLDSAARRIANDTPLISFSARTETGWDVWYRQLSIGARFETGNVCGTCEFWFRRLPAEAPSVEVPALQGKLTGGLASLDPDVVDAFARLLPAGEYRVALFRFVPVRVLPGSSEDYFQSEQRAVWWEPGHTVNDPATPYYRVRGRDPARVTARGDESFEFMVPALAGASLDPARVSFFEAALADGAGATAVAIGILDVKQYYDSATAHWCAAHYLLDGHHKVEAAARGGAAITLLSFIACDAGVSGADDVDALLAGYPRAPAPASAA